MTRAAIIAHVRSPRVTNLGKVGAALVAAAREASK